MHFLAFGFGELRVIISSYGESTQEQYHSNAVS